MIDNRPQSLSGKFVGTFAYDTIKDRLPNILTKAIDVISRKASDYYKINDVEKADDAKHIVSLLSKLKNEMQTDKKLRKLEDDFKDVKKWNEFLEIIPIIEDANSVPSWYSVAWLYCECYMYRRIFEALYLSKHHKNYDPFFGQKSEAFYTSENAMKSLSEYVLSVLDVNKEKNVQCDFETLIQYSLWGNKCDLSISAGTQVDNQLSESDQLNKQMEYILCNQSQDIWNHINDSQNDKQCIDIILDNAGFELFTDLCLAEFLIHKKICKEIKFHVKTMPWFVSDTLKNDFIWTIEQCMKSTDTNIRSLGTRWNESLLNGNFKIVENDYWCLPNDFSDMNKNDSEMYLTLQDSKLIIFKGDLNYRKLVGDRNWPFDTPFATGLNGFCPSPLCSLRTLKGDVVVGIESNLAQKLDNRNRKWMTTGSYAVIQFCDALNLQYLNGST